MNAQYTDNKAWVRKSVPELLRAIATKTRKQKDLAIEKRLLALPEFRAAKSVLLYASFGHEVYTRGLIAHCLSAGLVTALPRVGTEDDRLHIYQIHGPGDLAPGYRGISEPQARPEREISLDRIDIIVAPGVAFDESCCRLGRGKGYYDRLLGSAADRPQRPFFAALACEEQIVPFIYCGPYDIKMDAVITDARTIYRHGS
jgi:5-formyltetrahydrofolate cyclo-ligase